MMFIEALLLSIIIGYFLKGSIKNIDADKIKGVYIPFISFGVEVLIFIPVRNGIINPGIATLAMYVVEYSLIFIFIYLNRNNRWVLMMGIGFMLNAAVIFSNGGLMPVSKWAIDVAGITDNVSAEGLYTLVGPNTRLWFLGDVMPYGIIRRYVVSIGDIVASTGLMLFVISGMKNRKEKNVSV